MCAASTRGQVSSLLTSCTTRGRAAAPLQEGLHGLWQGNGAAARGTQAAERSQQAAAGAQWHAAVGCRGQGRRQGRRRDPRVLLQHLPQHLRAAATAMIAARQQRLSRGWAACTRADLASCSCVPAVLEGPHMLASHLGPERHACAGTAQARLSCPCLWCLWERGAAALMLIHAGAQCQAKVWHAAGLQGGHLELVGAAYPRLTCAASLRHWRAAAAHVETQCSAHIIMG